MRKTINICIALVITKVVTAIVTYALSLRFEKPTEETPAFDVPDGTVAAPVKGTVVAMENLPDETFAAGVLGKGVGVQPESGVVTAPFSGKVTQVAETGHAIGLESADGLEVLIHVGVDTVDMNGVGFTPKVKVGDTVRPGQEILAFDRAAIKRRDIPTSWW